MKLAAGREQDLKDIAALTSLSGSSEFEPAGIDETVYGH